MPLPAGVALPPGAVLDPGASQSGVRLVANVALSVDEVVGFYGVNTEWNLVGQATEGDVVVIQVESVEAPADAAQITLRPAALTSGSTTTNLVIEGLPAEEP